jgi:hypothetical protein
MPQADAQQRPAVRDGRPCQARWPGQTSRIAWARREHQPGHVVCQRLGHAHVVRQHADAHAALHQSPHDATFQSVVDYGNDGSTRADVVRSLRGDLRHEVLILPALLVPRSGRCRFRVAVVGGRDDRALRPRGAQVAREGPRIQAGDGRHAPIAEKMDQLTSIVGDGGRSVGHDEATKPRPR